MICFDESALKSLFEISKKQKIREEMDKKGYSSEDLQANRGKMQEIVDEVKGIEDKEEIEIFSAVFCYLNFYPGSKVCFLLKGEIDPSKNKIDSLKKLKTALKENDLTDFGFMSQDGFRAFQLKAYKGITAINDFFTYVKKVLIHYGNNLGEVNLLFAMQSKGDFTGDFFHELHRRIIELNLKGSGQILVSYNEENKADVIITVYPELGTARVTL